MGVSFKIDTTSYFVFFFTKLTDILNGNSSEIHDMLLGGGSLRSFSNNNVLLAFLFMIPYPDVTRFSPLPNV